MSKMKLLSRQPNGVTFANPNDPDFQVRFKHTSNRKTIDGIAVDNHISEIIISDLNAVVFGQRTINDSLSVRVRVSGSSLSQERLKAILTSLISDLPKWTNESVLVGFSPETAPSIPA